MDALKLIPQAFFEFFARLVPGFLAFALWIGLFGGDVHWPHVLGIVMAGGVTTDNTVSAVLVIGLSGCYVAGQLVAPFGKLMQWLTEKFVTKGKSGWTRMKELLKRGEPSAPATKPGPKDPSPPTGDYDWLRAKFPDQGALVGKIRAEYTMFYSLSAIVVTALLARGFGSSPVARLELVILALFAVAFATRGFNTKKTCNETAKKLRTALM